MIRWKPEERKIGGLYENSANPRILHEEEGCHLRKSLEDFGLCQPIVVQPDGLIIRGHQRVSLLKEMGVEEVAVNVPERYLSDEEYNELSLRLNKNMGDWDYDVLSTFFETETLVEVGFSLKELGIGVEKEKPPQKYILNISFINAEDLQRAQEEIEKILEKYIGASCKKRKIKNKNKE